MYTYILHNKVNVKPIVIIMLYKLKMSDLFNTLRKYSHIFYSVRSRMLATANQCILFIVNITPIKGNQVLRYDYNVAYVRKGPNTIFKNL